MVRQPVGDGLSALHHAVNRLPEGSGGLALKHAPVRLGPPSGGYKIRVAPETYQITGSLAPHRIKLFLIFSA